MHQRPHKRKKVHPLYAQLYDCRREANITGEAVANAIGWNQQTLARAERGLCNSSLNFVCDYAAYFGFDVVLQKRGIGNEDSQKQ